MKHNTQNRAAGNRRRRVIANALLTLICACASVAGLLNAPRAFAQTGVINDPPVAPHLITVFPERDFVSAEGYDPAGGIVTISVIRGGAVVSQAHVTPDRFGIAEVNHPGGACWEVVTPDIRPGDVVRVTTAAGVSDQTTVANVTAGLPVQVDGTTVQIHGTAQDAAGAQLPLAQIEARLLNPDRFDNGRRTLRAPGDGTLAYDAAGSVNWTATFTNLSAADMAKALDSESRILWLGRNPLAGVESTIFEKGADVFGGPQAPCTAPSETGQNPPPPISPAPPAPAYTVLNDPPAAPRIVGAFPERDFVSAEGYTPGQLVTINVLRKQTTNVVNPDGTTTQQVTFVTVGAAQNVPANADGIVEVNHIGGACWEGQTPDIRPGDIVRATSNGVADQTTVANIISTRPIQINSNTVVIHGSAIDANGAPLPIAQIDTRLVGSSSDPFDLSGRRDLRAPGDGTVAFDATGSTNFTVTYTGLTATDIIRVMEAESRTVWTGRDPLAGTESTTFETGGDVFPGPQAPCVIPQEPRLSVTATPTSGASDLGTTLSVTLAASEADADIYYTTNGTTPTTTSTRYTGPIALTAKTILKFMAVDTANALMSQTFMEAYEFVDRTPPAAPSVPDLAAASDTGSSTTDNITRNTSLTFTGTAEAGSTVRLFIDGTQRASGTATTTGAYSLTATTVAAGAHTVTATAQDAAGNVSAASAALNVTVDTTNAGVTANPAGGTFASAVNVTLSSEAGAAIYYTTNGTTPTTASTRYTTAITISATTTLRAISVDVAGNTSAVMAQTYTIGGTVPAAPSNLTLTAPQQSRITLNWADNSSNETSFVIERSLSATTGFAQIGTVGANVRTFNDNTVARRTTYFYRVKAVNGAGSSAYSNVPSIRSL